MFGKLKKKKKTRDPPCATLNFFRLKEGYGIRKFQGRPPKLSKRKRAIIKRLSNGRRTLDEHMRDPAITVSKYFIRNNQ